MPKKKTEDEIKDKKTAKGATPKSKTAEKAGTKTKKTIKPKAKAVKKTPKAAAKAKKIELTADEKKPVKAAAKKTAKKTTEAKETAVKKVPAKKRISKKAVEETGAIKEDIIKEDIIKEEKKEIVKKAHVTAKEKKAEPQIAEEKKTEQKPAEKEVTKEYTKAVTEEVKPEIIEKKIIKVNETLTVKTLSEKLGIEVTDLIKKLLSLGTLATINQRLDFDVASLVAEEYNSVIELVPLYGDIDEEEEKEGIVSPRPPVVTIMGHVDHGKTTLLDTIRKSNIVDKEAGGITQHMGAYRVHKNGNEIIFLDTPGHEAFTAMRARGVKVTDIVIIVVAADDSIMPQTVEAIDHARAAGVPIIVAINKIDVPGANVEKVKQDLMRYKLVPEDWGGQTICVEISAKKNIGIDGLIEMIILQSEMLELKASYEGKARGVVVEAKMDKKRGAVAAVLIQKGTLRIGDSFVTGSAYGKVRFMVDDLGASHNEATPSIPVEVLGLNGIPLAGDKFIVVSDEREARYISEQRKDMFREEKLARKKHITLEELHKEIEEGKAKECNIILKADVRGSVEALRDSLEKMSNNEIKLGVIHSGVGAANESDIILAAASNAIVICFSAPPSAGILAAAEREGVDIRSYSIIYEVISDIKAAMEGLLEPDYKEVVTGKAEVRKIIAIPKIGRIAGSMVTEGKVIRGDFVRVYRGNAKLFEGKIQNLKRFKDDVKEVDKGYECGISIEGYQELAERDVLEFYHKEKVARRLEAR
ncbi:MAG: translation initiation factor IF-2 [Elusimicrobiota bacterium]